MDRPTWGDLASDVRSDSEAEEKIDETPWSDSNGFAATCEVCGSEKRNCHNHHISYEHDETIVACADCHYKIHNEPGFHDELIPREMLYKNPKTGNMV